jgi:hypothetical protein
VTWWAWTLLWVVLVVGAGVALFLVGRSLWRKASALLVELGEAAERMGAVSEQLELLSDKLSPAEPELAVFLDPVALRRDRDREVRRRVARARKQARTAPTRRR